MFLDRENILITGVIGLLFLITVFFTGNLSLADGPDYVFEEDTCTKTGDLEFECGGDSLNFRHENLMGGVVGKPINEPFDVLGKNGEVSEMLIKDEILVSNKAGTGFKVEGDRWEGTCRVEAEFGNDDGQFATLTVDGSLDSPEKMGCRVDQTDLTSDMVSDCPESFLDRRDLTCVEFIDVNLVERWDVYYDVSDFSNDGPSSVDSDGDGVPDSEDKAPNTPGSNPDGTPTLDETVVQTIGNVLGIESLQNFVFGGA